MSKLRDEAIRYLKERGQRGPAGAVTRVTLDVDVEGRVEMVTVSLRDDTLVCASSDGQQDGPHVQAAMRFIAGAPADAASAVAASPAVEEPALPEEPPQPLADAIDDLVTAVARVGAARALSEPSVEEALARLLQAAGEPTPPGLSRFVGRLRVALQRGWVTELARVLDGIATTAELLRGEPTPDATRRLAAWYRADSEASPDVDLLYDRTLVELAREWLPGTARNTIHRRYLVDTRSGTIYREDRFRGAKSSLGPCPRQIQVGLAEVEAGPAPQRIRILQYVVQPMVPAATWARLEQVASHGVEQLLADYQNAVRQFPALAEPFVLMAPHTYRATDSGLRAYDRDGLPLLISRTDRRGLVDAFNDVSGRYTPRWLVGRLDDSEGATMLLPYGVCVSEEGRAVYHRLR